MLQSIVGPVDLYSAAVLIAIVAGSAIAVCAFLAHRSTRFKDQTERLKVVGVKPKPGELVVIDAKAQRRDDE